MVKLYYNMGNRDEAYASLRSYAKTYPEEAGYALFRLAFLQEGTGLAGDLGAMREYQGIIEHYPESRFTPAARTRLAQLNTKRLLEEQEGTL